MSTSDLITNRVFGAARDMATYASPDVTLAPDGLNRRHQFDAWCASLDGIFVYRLLEDGRSRAPLQGAWWQVGSGAAFEVRYGGLLFESVLHRSRALSLDYCMLLLLRSGLADGLIDGELLRLQPGNLHLLDLSRTQVGRCEEMHQVAVMLPFDVFGYDPRRHAPAVTLPLGAPEGILLSSALEALLKACCSADAQAQHRLSEGFGRLTHSLMLGGEDEEAAATVEATRATALRSYLEDHYLDADLSAARLGTAVGASRATVYRVFEPDGGVDAAIRKRKLRRAALELSLAAPSRGIVRQVAEKYGFEDVNQFSRSFRRELGYAANEVVGLTYDRAAPLRQKIIAAPRSPRDRAVSRLFR